MISEDTRKAMGQNKLADGTSFIIFPLIKTLCLCSVIHSGEFWMEFFTDFCREFEEVSICTLGPDFNHDGAVDEAKSVKVILGEWVKDLTSGGCRNDMTKFSTNPQFLLEIPDPSTSSTSVSNVKSQVLT